MRSTKNQAINLIRQSLDRLDELRDKRAASQEFKIWRSNTQALITELFRDSPSHASEFKKLRFTPVRNLKLTMSSAEQRGEMYDQTFQRGLDQASALLGSMLFLVEQFWDDQQEDSETLASNGSKNEMNSTRIFVVHGRDGGTKDTTARFLTNLQLDPVVLQEQPNQGRTIIEKFEDYVDVGFAVVLFTPDDEGGLAGDQQEVKPRTRQNVIFEQGFFLGRLGRDRVVVLVKGDVEIPSDYSGVLFIPFDDLGAWKMQLMGELKSAGYSIDANLVIDS